jgi:predicted dehydrogenase
LHDPSQEATLRIGIAGCGFVSALYVRTLELYPDLRIVGVTDLIRERREALGRRAKAPVFDSVDELLARSGADILLNLTNPRAHHAVNRAALEAGKHVYCEKPLAMDLEEARGLVDLAARRGLRLSGAPCNVLGEAAQAVWRELRRGAIGVPRVVYAELDDGMIHLAPYRRWDNELGVPWPAKDEFEVGCTLEHAGYYLTWLVTFFGPAESVTRFGATTIPDKGTPEPLAVISPDFTVACIRFRSGVVARLTCSIVAPHDHRLRIVGDEGVLTVDDCWDYRSRAAVRKWMTVRRRLLLHPLPRPVRLPAPPVRGVSRFGSASMDFARGVAELARAIRFDVPGRLSPEMCLHITELSLAIHDGARSPGLCTMTTRFEPMEPMPWAR